MKEEIDNGNRGRNIAIIAYLTFIGLIVAFVLNNEKKDEFVSFHIGQSLGLGLTGVTLVIINLIPILGWILSILGSVLILVLWMSGLLSALNGKEKPVPLLGKQYQKWFKHI